MVLLVWILFCFIFLNDSDSLGISAYIGQSVLDSVAGFFIMGLTWVYRSYWNNVEKKGAFFFAFSYIYFPLSPLIYLLLDSTKFASSIAITAYSIVVITISLFMKDKIFNLYENLIKKDEKDKALMNRIHFRSDVIFYDVLYWGALAVIYAVFG